jgi:hypothetical protein
MEMIPYGKARAVEQQRAGSFFEASERAAARRKASYHEPGSLVELLSFLANGLASLGIPGNRGKGFPASPAY